MTPDDMETGEETVASAIETSIAAYNRGDIDFAALKAFIVAFPFTPPPHLAVLHSLADEDDANAAEGMDVSEGAEYPSPGTWDEVTFAWCEGRLTDEELDALTKAMDARSATAVDVEPRIRGHE